MLQGYKLSRQLSLFIAACLVLVVVAASLAILHKNGFLTGSNEPTPRILWQIDIEHFATDFTVADGKVFVSDQLGNVHCFDVQSGKSLWNASVGDYAPSTITVYERKVYVGNKGSVVNKLDMNTGKLELTFQAPVTSSYGSKSAPEFFVADGKVFASQDGIAVYNASDGELFWKTNRMGVLESPNISAPESDYIFIMGHSRVNPNNGSIIWSISGGSSGATNVTHGKLLFWNYNPAGSADEGKSLLCVNASSGEESWIFNVGSRMFQPTVSDDIVLFGAEDGYLYAVNFADGTLNWRTFVDDQHLIETFNSYTEAQKAIIHMSASSVQVDPQNKRVFWSVIVGYNGDNVYNGTVWALDLSDGNRIWTLPVINDGSVFTNYAAFASVTLSNTLLYVTEHSDLYCLDANTGTIKLRQNFEHYVLPPIAADNKVFIAADLWLIAYE
jgi:outer membrane protein assembly factor BamB